MASVFVNVCRFNPTAGGTTDWTVSSAVTGYDTPANSGAVNGATYSYRAESANLAEWEIGAGVYTSGTTVLARTTVLLSSAALNAKVSFTAAPQVAIVALAEDLLPIANVAPITNSLGADVLTNSTGSYFDGPTVAQGSVGTWFASGTVTVIDSGAGRNFNCKLWDGTTVIASATVSTAAAGFSDTVTLSGFITSPAGNLRISVNEPSATTGKIQFNQSGNSKDSTITAFRIK